MNNEKLCNVLRAMKLNARVDGDFVIVRDDTYILDERYREFAFDRTNLKHVLGLMLAYEVSDFKYPMYHTNQFIEHVLQEVERIYDEMDHMYIVVGPCSLIVGQVVTKVGLDTNLYRPIFTHVTPHGVAKRVEQNILWRGSSVRLDDGIQKLINW